MEEKSAAVLSLQSPLGLLTVVQTFKNLHFFPAHALASWHLDTDLDVINSIPSNLVSPITPVHNRSGIIVEVGDTPEWNRFTAKRFTTQHVLSLSNTGFLCWLLSCFLSGEGGRQWMKIRFQLKTWLWSTCFLHKSLPNRKSPELDINEHIRWHRTWCEESDWKRNSRDTAGASTAWSGMKAERKLLSW